MRKLSIKNLRKIIYSSVAALLVIFTSTPSFAIGVAGLASLLKPEQIECLAGCADQLNDALKRNDEDHYLDSVDCRDTYIDDIGDIAPSECDPNLGIFLRNCVASYCSQPNADPSICDANNDLLADEQSCYDQADDRKESKDRAANAAYNACVRNCLRSSALK